MLIELNIKNLIIINNLNVEFHPGLNIITGETGAGKTIIVEAINLALGKKMKTKKQNIIGNKSNIELVFDVDNELIDDFIMAEYSIEDSIFVVSREIFPNGKSISRLNGKVITQSNLKNITDKIIDVHGQHMHQSLLDEKIHLKMLDDYGKSILDPIKFKLEEITNEYEIIKKDIKKIEKIQPLEDLEYIKFQINEIEKANIKLDIDLELENTYNEMNHVEDIMNYLKNTIENIENDSSILDLLSNSKNNLYKLKSISDKYCVLYDRFDSLNIEIEDILQELKSEFAKNDFDEVKYREIEQRLDVLNLLSKKYGPTLKDVIEYLNENRKKLLLIENRDASLKNLYKNLDDKYDDYVEQAENLSKERKKVFIAFKNVIVNEIAGLNLTDIVLEAEFEQVKELDKYKVHKNGFDYVRFLISTDKKMGLKPLKEIASGGEISRIMLGIKVALSKIDTIDTMIFDEIDTGISGETAYKVGKKMAALSNEKQIIAITHLPQIAAASDCHFKIEKLDGVSTLTPLSEQGKIDEIARIISGKEIDQESIQNSISLIKQAKEN